MRVFNFSAGPCTLPVEVLEQAAAEMVDFQGSGMSVMEMSHRSKVYQGIFDETEERFKRVLNIPSNYKVLFLQGGASTQFAMVPLNIGVTGKAAYINTGAWSKKAIEEGNRYLTAEVIASSEDKNFTYVPESPKIEKEYDYVHITSNNTIFGTRFTSLPETGDVPLVADMSSFIAAEKTDFSKYGVAYAGAQKNLGPAGVTVVVIREDLLDREPNAITPTMLRYTTHSDKGSMFNTPPCYSIYIVGLVLEWLENIGGIAEMERRNKEKAYKLYDYIDSSDLYNSPVRPEDRSLMNVTFLLKDKDLEQDFIAGSAAAGLVNLKGHRSVGGMRASIYNAMPLAGVKKLISFIQKFDKAHS